MSNQIKYVDNRQFHKSNYDSALKSVIPSLYFEQDYAYKDSQIDILDKVINSHLNIIQNTSSLLNISGVAGTIYSGIDTPEGIAPFFVKQNNLTDIDSNDFERKILIPLNTNLRAFDTSSDFQDYLEDTLLPGIRRNAPTLDFLEGGTSAANHNYLITNLSWLYFLNFGSGTLDYNPSSFVLDTMVDKFYTGREVTINDGIKGLTKYLWNNYETCTAWQSLSVIPADFRPPSLTQDDTYTSGTQQLDKLLTLIDVLYSPLFIDNGDARVRDAIDDYLTNGYTLTTKTLTGPFVKLVKAFSFAFADYSNYVDEVEILNDLNLCPDDLLPELARTIGWRLFGSEPDRWRLQLANAVDIYRATGTKKSIQFAVDAVLGQDVFDVSSQISELWESYIPFLIYYSLATESTMLESFATWTEDTSRTFGIRGYSSSSMDDNIRLCTDQIISELVQLYRPNFIFNKAPFPADSIDFKFNYRNREMPIPPFEEIPYYLNVRLTRDMVDSIVDKLVCYGVPQTFALTVGDYINEHVFDRTDDLALKNGWLFFTSGATYPDNWNDLIKDISNKRTEYLPLWNGKSSHFKVLFEASSFDFAKTSLEADSRETIRIASQAAQEFSPAHAIPDVIAIVNDEDDYSNSAVEFIYLNYNKTEQGLLYTSAAGMSRYGASALYTTSYKRGLTTTGVASFSRGDVDSIVDSRMSSSGSTAILPRRAHRRFNLKNTLPRDGFYDYTGDNQPVGFTPYQDDITDPVLYLGLIPSSLTWVPIPDYKNIPQIYAICENLNSSSVYSGLAVSNTYPVRGWTSVAGGNDRYLDHGQLDPFVATVHYIQEQAKHLQASAHYYANPTYYDVNKNWMNVLGSYANSATEVSGWFPNAFSNYTNYGFGRDFHKLYYDYCHNFNRHRVSPNIVDYDGPVILSHALGSLLYNSKFDVQPNLSLITSSLASTVEITTSTTTGAFSTTSIFTSSGEYRNSGVLSHIEFVQLSGTSPQNNFAVIDIDPSRKSSIRRNQLLDSNILIKQSAYDGFGRIVFDISKYTLPSQYDVTSNFLSPDHDFEFNLKAAITDAKGIRLGGGTVGVWIHTSPEANKMWSFAGDTWVQHSASALSLGQVLSYINLYNLPDYQRDTSSTSKFKCLKFLDPNNPNQKNDVIASLLPEDFTQITIKFHTKNKDTEVPASYFDNIANNVHRLSQDYVIEVFTIPTRDDRFSLYYDLDVKDMTLNKWSKPYVTSVGCTELRVDLSKQHILNILKYFKGISGGLSNLGYASMVASTTSGIYETSGGSKINYVESPLWNTNTVNVIGMIEDLTIIN